MGRQQVDKSDTLRIHIDAPYLSHEAIKRAAKLNHMSMNGFCLLIIEQYLAREDADGNRVILLSSPIIFKEN